MAKRAELWQIARGVLTSFASRNNDICGYWGIGVLARLVQDERRVFFELQLQPAGFGQSSPVLSAVATRYSALLVRNLAKAHVPSTWLTAAKLSFSYPAIGVAPQFARTALIEQPYECLLEIADERKHTKHFVWSGWCWPQGAGPESRSTRMHDL